MSVDGVNNSNNNTALYATSGAVLGAGVGAATGYMTKSILKDGQYTDEFVSCVHSQMMKSEKGQALLDICKLDPNSANYTTEMYEVIKKHAKILGIDPNEVSKGEAYLAQEFCGANELLKEQTDALKEMFKNACGEDLKLGKDTNVSELLKKACPENIDEVFDRTNKTFKSDISKNSKETLELVKKAMRDVKLKSAGIYGAVGAVAFGIAGYLCGTMGSNKEQPQKTSQKVDTQA